MQWGRARVCKGKKTVERYAVPSVRAANAIAVIGSIVCVLFLCRVPIGVSENSTSYSAEESAAVIQTFLKEHAAFADAIGLEAYFSEDSISVGAFSDRGDEAYRAFLEQTEREWTFRDYLWDAVRSLFGAS